MSHHSPFHGGGEQQELICLVPASYESLAPQEDDALVFPESVIQPLRRHLKPHTVSFHPNPEVEIHLVWVKLNVWGERAMQP